MSSASPGETADFLAALREAKKKGCKVLGIVNVVGSSLPEKRTMYYTPGGPEIAVVTTKAYSLSVDCIIPSGYALCIRKRSDQRE